MADLPSLPDPVPQTKPIFFYTCSQNSHVWRHFSLLFFLTFGGRFVAIGSPGGAMAKTVISAEPGALMRVAKGKGIGSLKALSEKTGSDRKTLRAINAGRPVKDTTLQTIADRLHVPPSHFCKDHTSSPEDDLLSDRRREDLATY